MNYFWKEAVFWNNRETALLTWIDKFNLRFLCYNSEVMEVPGPPLSEQDSRKYFIDMLLGIEYCK